MDWWSEGATVGDTTVAPSGPASVDVTTEIRPKPDKQVSTADLRKKLMALGYSAAGAEGMVRNIMRESRGEPEVIGDSGTSGGLFQHHAERFKGLKDYAASEGKPWTDPDVQIAFADKEMQGKFPSLRKRLMASEDPADAEDEFKRVFERPRSVMWGNTAPVMATDSYRFSDYALGEHAGRPNTSVVAMDPQDYLDLSPGIEGEPGQSRSAKSLLSSIQAGDAVEAIPTLDLRGSGPTATVVDQDGRHRALYAQQAGLDAIPVAVRGAATPTEVVGMQGKVLPGTSIGQKLSDLLVPRAQAAEPKWWEQEAKPEPAQGGQEVPWWQQGATTAETTAKPQMSAWDAFWSGQRDPIEGGAQLLEHVTPTPVSNAVNAADRALGGTMPPGGMDEAVRQREANLAAEGIGQHPWARMLGEITSPANLAVAARTGGLGSSLGRIAETLASGGVAGGASSLLQPVASDDYWATKARELVAGTIAGAGTGAVLGAVGKLASGPGVTSLARKLMNEGVELTPGQMSGGFGKWFEDTMMSVPVMGSAIRAARQRSLDTFNQAAINRALDPIGEKVPKNLTGHDAIGYAEQKFRDAYNRVIPKMVGQLDQPLQQDIGTVMQLGQNLPAEYRDQLRGIIQHDVLSNFSQGGGISGQTVQEIGTNLRNLYETMQLSENPDVRRLAGAVKEIDASLDRMLDRTNPGLAPAKDAIDAGYANFKIVQRASRYLGANNGTFTPAQLLNAVVARDKSKDKSATARGTALMQDLADAAKDVLPATVANSGTAERAAMLRMGRDVATGGAAFAFDPNILIGLGLGALPYTSPATKGINMLAKPMAGETIRAISPFVAGGVGAVAPSSPPTEQH